MGVGENALAASGPPGSGQIASRASRPPLRVGPGALVAPAGVGLLAFFVAPIVTFVVYSFLTPGPFTVSGPLTTAAYDAAFSEPLNQTLAWHSVRTGFCASVITVAVALPIAYWLRYMARRRQQVLVLFLVSASLFVSYLVRLYAWQTILGSTGIVNSGLLQLGLISRPLNFLLFSPVAVVIAAVHLYLPFAIITLFAGLRPLDETYLEAAQDLGANAFVRWRRVILPVMAQPLAATFLFVFVITSADWVMPSFLGGTNSVMLGQKIHDLFLTVGNYPAGAALSILMLGVYAIAYSLLGLALRGLRLAGLRWAS